MSTKRKPTDRWGNRDVKCQNCDWKGIIDDTGIIQKFRERVAPGEVCPVGECPECGSLANFQDVRHIYPWQTQEEITRRNAADELLGGAKDLLEAMKTDHRPEGKCGPTKTAAIRRVRNAIDKAEGRST